MSCCHACSLAATPIHTTPPPYPQNKTPCPRQDLTHKCGSRAAAMHARALPHAAWLTNRSAALPTRQGSLPHLHQSWCARACAAFPTTPHVFVGCQPVLLLLTGAGVHANGTGSSHATHPRRIMLAVAAMPSSCSAASAGAARVTPAARTCSKSVTPAASRRICPSKTARLSAAAASRCAVAAWNRLHSRRPGLMLCDSRHTCTQLPAACLTCGQQPPQHK